MHLGKACEAQNNEFMLCRLEEDDPRKCISDGKAVTSCAIDFFQKVKGACAAEFTQYAMCLTRSSGELHFHHCRKTQSVFDQCMKDKLDMDRPHYGYLALTKVHDTTRYLCVPHFSFQSNRTLHFDTTLSDFSRELLNNFPITIF